MTAPGADTEAPVKSADAPPAIVHVHVHRYSSDYEDRERSYPPCYACVCAIGLFVAIFWLVGGVPAGIFISSNNPDTVVHKITCNITITGVANATALCYATNYTLTAGSRGTNASGCFAAANLNLVTIPCYRRGSALTLTRPSPSGARTNIITWTIILVPASLCIAIACAIGIWVATRPWGRKQWPETCK